MLLNANKYIGRQVGRYLLKNTMQFEQENTTVKYNKTLI